MLGAKPAARLAVMLPAPKRFEKPARPRPTSGPRRHRRHPHGRCRAPLIRPNPRRGHRAPRPVPCRNRPMNPTLLAEEIAAAAARLVVVEGHGRARQAQGGALGWQAARGRRCPATTRSEDEVRLPRPLHADTQPVNCARCATGGGVDGAAVAAFRPHLAGAVWRGTATRLSSLIRSELFCDDPKAAEIDAARPNLGRLRRAAGGTRGDEVGDVDAGGPPAAGLNRRPSPHLVLDHDDLRGALKPDARGRSDLRRRPAGPGCARPMGHRRQQTAPTWHGSSAALGIGRRLGAAGMGGPRLRRPGAGRNWGDVPAAAG